VTPYLKAVMHRIVAIMVRPGTAGQKGPS